MRSTEKLFQEYAQAMYGLNKEGIADVPVRRVDKLATVTLISKSALSRSQQTPALGMGEYAPMEVAACDVAIDLMRYGFDVWGEAEKLVASQWTWLAQYDLPNAGSSDSWFLAMIRFILEDKPAHAVALLALFTDELNLSIERVVMARVEQIKQKEKEDREKAAQQNTPQRKEGKY